MELNPKTVLCALAVMAICLGGWGIILAGRSFIRAMATASALGSIAARAREQRELEGSENAARGLSEN